jgi:diguanylate cyclase (GGDEF)-like protein/PAS domain S-box-containing protein
MVESRANRRQDPTEPARNQIGRLISACTRIQADVERLLESESAWAIERVLLKAIINQVPELLYAKDLEGRFIAANDAVARDNGLKRAVDVIGKTDFDLHPTDAANVFFQIEQRIISSGQPMIDMEELRTDESGDTKWLLTTKVPMKGDRGEIVGLIGVARNITERKRAEQAWKDERALFRAMVDQVPDYLFAKDTESRFVVANKAVAADLGLKSEDLLGKTDFELHPPELARKFFTDEQTVIRSSAPMIDIEEFVVDRAGTRKWLSTSKVPLRNDQDEVIGIVGIARDVTDRKRAEDQIHFMAHHDALTGLPNRALLMDRLTQALLLAQRNECLVTVIFIDLDNFKLVNDSFGHNAGDTLLKTLAERMVRCVRATDTVVRLGGDEFVVLLIHQVDSPIVASLVLDKIREALAEPVPIDGQLFRVTCSIGLATYPHDGADAETLLMNADVAMYQAKEKGRDNFQYYTTEMDVTAHAKRTLQNDLRTGLARNEFALVYQPQVDLQSGRIFSTEALVRWHHPELGTIAPAQFIPLAEESGLIVPLGDWVLREACRQNKAWQDAGMLPITMSVNVSARQFREANWVQRVADVLKETGLKPQYLELELTESLLMQDVHQAIATMQKLQAIGVQFSIDDFGTGYSSLSALKSFPVARLKIDQSFVRNLPHNTDDCSIAAAVISLGHKLNMKVIAEGVESDAQMAFLAENNCDEIQGFRISRPVEADAIAAMLLRQSDNNLAEPRSSSP